MTVEELLTDKRLSPRTRAAFRGDITPGAGLFRTLKTRKDCDAAVVLDLRRLMIERDVIKSCFESSPLAEGPFSEVSRLVSGLSYVIQLIEDADAYLREVARKKLALACKNFIVTDIKRLRGQYRTVIMTVIPNAGRKFTTSLTIEQIQSQKGAYFASLCYGLGYFRPDFDLALLVEYLVDSAEEVQSRVWRRGDLRERIRKTIRLAIKSEVESEGRLAWYDVSQKRVLVRPDFLVHKLCLEVDLVADVVSLIHALRDLGAAEWDMAIGWQGNQPATAKERVWAFPAPVIQYKPKHPGGNISHGTKRPRVPVYTDSADTHPAGDHRGPGPAVQEPG